jgi:hypothetical protein
MTAPAANKLELETFAGKSIQAYKDQAAKAGLVLRAPSDVTESGDFPRSIYDSLRHFRRNIAITQNHRKVVTSLHRSLVSERDDKGRPTKKEYLTYLGYYSGTTHKGEEYHANFLIGKYEKPKIVPNGNLTYDPKTGEPKGNEKMLGGPETVYTIEVPKSKTERKKLIDEIIGDNFPEEIKYYFDNEDEPLGRSDSTFTYSEFCDDTIEELRKKSFQGGGSLTPGIWRDNDGKLRDKFGQLLTPESGNKGAYQ